MRRHPENVFYIFWVFTGDPSYDMVGGGHVNVDNAEAVVIDTSCFTYLGFHGFKSVGTEEGGFQKHAGG